MKLFNESITPEQILDFTHKRGDIHSKLRMLDRTRKQYHGNDEIQDIINKEITRLNDIKYKPLEEKRKRKKKRKPNAQGYFVKYNAGDVEKGQDMFNRAMGSNYDCDCGDGDAGGMGESMSINEGLYRGIPGMHYISGGYYGSSKVEVDGREYYADDIEEFVWEGFQGDIEDGNFELLVDEDGDVEDEEDAFDRWVEDNEEMFHSATDILRPITTSHRGREYVIRDRIVGNDDYDYAVYKAEDWTDFGDSGIKNVYFLSDYDGKDIFKVFDNHKSARTAFNDTIRDLAIEYGDIDEEEAYAQIEDNEYDLIESMSINEECTRINLRDELNKLDCEECDGEYVNLYDAANLDKEDKKTLAEMLCGGKVKSVKPFLTEAYIKTIRR